MSKALKIFFKPFVAAAIALSRLVDPVDRKVSKGGDRRKADRRQFARV